MKIGKQNGIINMYLRILVKIKYIVIKHEQTNRPVSGWISERINPVVIVPFKPTFPLDK